MKIRFMASQTVRYDQTKNISAKELAELKSYSPEDFEDEGGPLTSWLDLRDVVDAGDFEVDQIAVVDDDGKVIGEIL